MREDSTWHCLTGSRIRHAFRQLTCKLNSCKTSNLTVHAVAALLFPAAVCLPLESSERFMALCNTSNLTAHAASVLPAAAVCPSLESPERFMALCNTSNLTAHAAAASLLSATVCPPVKRCEEIMALCNISQLTADAASVSPAPAVWLPVKQHERQSHISGFVHFRDQSIRRAELCKVACTSHTLSKPEHMAAVWMAQYDGRFCRRICRRLCRSMTAESVASQSNASELYDILLSPEMHPWDVQSCAGWHIPLRPVARLATKLQHN